MWAPVGGNRDVYFLRREIPWGWRSGKDHAQLAHHQYHTGGGVTLIEDI